LGDGAVKKSANFRCISADAAETAGRFLSLDMAAIASEKTKTMIFGDEDVSVTAYSSGAVSMKGKSFFLEK
jgi:hypothetical protein